MLARRAIACGLAALALGVAACGEETSEEAAGGGKEESAESNELTEEATPEAPTAAGDKPKVTVPDGDPPKQLQVKDLKKGTGATAQSGGQIQVNYVGVTYSSGEEFDSSFDAGQPFTFTLGAGEVIPGWDQGVAGMKVGGRRRLIIPPAQAYGAQGSPPAIGPNETLVFVIDLLDA